MPASQDYRDGASTGAHTVKERLLQLELWDVPITRAVIEAVSEGVCSEWGGTVEDTSEESKLREAWNSGWHALRAEHDKQRADPEYPIGRDAESRNPWDQKTQVFGDAS